MSFTKRWNPRPPLPKCKQCGVRPQIAGRKDQLCDNCAHGVDQKRAERARAAK
jgi:tRNA(Ile2) C34 agmatinyltransferase TiaS